MLRAGLALVLLLSAATGRATADGPGEPRFVALTATFRTETRIAKSTQRRAWRLTRTEDQVEYEWLDDGWADIWRLEEGGELSLLKVSDAERTFVEYGPIQVRALGSAPSWRALNSVLPQHPREMGLRLTGKLRALGQPAERYVGELASKSITLIWLPRERLPYRFVTKEGTRTTITLLRGLSFAAPLMKKERPLNSYRRLAEGDAMQAQPALPAPRRRPSVQLHF